MYSLHFGNKMRLFFLILTLITMLFLSCKQAYTPPAITSPGSYLVVEGVINNSSDSTIIKLSYTVNIASKTTKSPVLNAKVDIQGDQNTTYHLTEATNGKYVTTNLNLDTTHKYRLIITTDNNNQYYSDYVPVLNSPPIDSVYYSVSNKTVNINSATHDVTNTIKFFRWDYKETYIIHSAYFSYFKSDGYNIYLRDLVNDNIYQCWASDTSSVVVLNTTTKLKQSLLTDNIITSFPLNSEKVAYRYSILVSQYALSTDAYNFWTNLKKNTEKLGGIFDAQPSQINGNMHCLTNPKEVVIGYISVGSVATKRVFINHEQLPQIAPNFATASCVLDSLWYHNPKTGENQVYEFIKYKRSNLGIIFVPIQSFKDDNGTILGYLSTTPFCADCTLRGTNRKPDFWE
jgi:hypothetical protein